jgi:hypothetical protein
VIRTGVFLFGEGNRNQENRDCQLLTTLALRLQTFHGHTAFQVSVLEMLLLTRGVTLMSHRVSPLITAKGAMPRAATRSQRPAPSQSQLGQRVQQARGGKPGNSRTRRKMKRTKGMWTRTELVDKWMSTEKTMEIPYPLPLTDQSRSPTPFGPTGPWAQIQ